MSDHEFEKQVRQKLTDLKITPSAQAWENIEEKLRDKKRRGPLLWLPLLLAGMALGGYLLLENKSERSPLNQKFNTPAATLHMPSGDLPANSDKSGTAHDKNVHFSENDSVNNEMRQQDIAVTPITHRAGGTTSPNNISPKKRGEERNLVKYNTRTGKVDQQADNSSTVSEEVEMKKKGLAEDKIAANDDAVNGEDSLTDKTTTATGKKNKNLPATVLPAIEQNKTAAATKLQPPKITDSKWSYAVHVNAGVASASKGIFPGKKPAMMQSAYPSNFFAATIVNYAPVYRPATTLPEFAFSAGVLVKKELSKRLSLSAGLDYTQMTMKLQAGEKVNVNIPSSVVRASLLTNYGIIQDHRQAFKNKYHFIEVPVMLHVRLNNSVKLPLYWDAGIIVSKMIGSASTAFDEWSMQYYQDDSLLKKTQVGIGSGVSVVLFNKSSHPLWVGPSVRYNLSPISKTDLSDSRHFMTWGIDLKFFLKK